MTIEKIFEEITLKKKFYFASDDTLSKKPAELE